MSELPGSDADDIAQIQYTSGSRDAQGSDAPPPRHREQREVHTQRLGLGRRDVWLCPMPLFHTGGCVGGVLCAVQAQATLVLMSEFDPGVALDLIEQEHVTAMLGVPTMLIGMREHPTLDRRDTATFQRVMFGGTTVPAELVRDLQTTFGTELQIFYGKTEAAPVVTQTRSTDSPEDMAGTVGTAQPQTEVAILDPDTHEVLPVGQQGEICTRGYLVMAGYHDQPEATAIAIDEDGGCTPVTSAQWTSAGTCGSPVASRTWSSGAREHLPTRDRGSAVRASDCLGGRRDRPAR
ncbi:MAG TPA: AMP-binding protein [Nitriliruptorales bacterium]